MPNCCAFGCSKKYVRGSGTSFHMFPHSQPKLLKQWIANMRWVKWAPSKWDRICSDHFEAKHFDRTGQTVRLRESAVPTIFNFPPHLQKKVPKRKNPKLREQLPVADRTKTSPVPDDKEERSLVPDDKEERSLVPDDQEERSLVPDDQEERSPVPADVPEQVLTSGSAPDECSSPHVPRQGPSTYDDHHYYTSESNVKRRLQQEKMVNKQRLKKLRTLQQANRRLLLKVDSLNQEVVALRKERLMSINKPASEVLPETVFIYTT